MGSSKTKPEPIPTPPADYVPEPARYVIVDGERIYQSYKGAYRPTKKG